MPNWENWHETIRYSSDGPGVTLLHQSGALKVVLVGLGTATGRSHRRLSTRQTARSAGTEGTSPSSPAPAAASTGGV